MTYISEAQWQTYRNIINVAHESFNQDTIIWFKHTSGLQRFGEDNKSLDKFTQIPLKCLVNYNVFRQWPMNKESESGLIDKESISIILNRHYLDTLGYIDSNHNFIIDPGLDYFVHQGQKLRASGETPASQAKDDPLLVILILKRMGTKTGDNKY